MASKSSTTSESGESGAARSKDAGARLGEVLGDLAEMGDDDGEAPAARPATKSGDDRRAEHQRRKARETEKDVARTRAAKAAAKDADEDDDDDDEGEDDDDSLLDKRGDSDEDDDDLADDEGTDADEDEDDEEDDESDDDEDEAPAGKRKTRAQDADRTPADDSLHAVTANGVEHRLTYKQMREHASMGMDYTRDKQATAGLQEQYRGMIDQMHEYLEAATGPGKEPDWAKLEQDDPLGFAPARARWDDALRQKATVAAEKDRLAGEAQKDFQVKYTAHMNAEKEKLPLLIPQWKDKAVAKQEIAVIKRYLAAEGFTPQEIGQLADARAIKMIRKAALYDRIKRSGQKKLKPVRLHRPAAEPGTRREVTRHGATKQRLKDARRALKRSGSDRDAERAMGALLDA